MTNKLISLVILMFILSIDHSYSDEQFLLPKEKPSIFKKINKDPGKAVSSNLPKKKPIISQNVDQKKEVVKKKEEIVKQKEEVKNVKVIPKKSAFVFPQKKPTIYKSKAETAQRSSILNQKDFDRAKETIQFIKDKKWNSALKSAAKVKDK